MEMTAMARACQLIMLDNGLGLAEEAERVAAAVAERTDPAQVAEFDAWWVTLTEEQRDVACGGCDITEPGGPLTVTDGCEPPETVVVVPQVCSDLLNAMFEESWDF